MSTRHQQEQSSLIKDESLRAQIAKRPFRRRVDPLNNSLDFHTALLGGFGFSSSYIAKRTGFTPGQITYRLHKAGVKISDFRNGRGAIARHLLKEHQQECEPLLRQQITAALKAHRI